MIIELAFAIGAAIAGNGIPTLTNKRFPRPIYSALIGWWWGSFAEDSPGALLASMIESDLNCDVWEHSRHWCYDGDYNRINYDLLQSEHYKAKMYFKRGRVKLHIIDKSGRWNEYKVTAYEDYLLCLAKNRWKSRKANNEILRIKKDCMDTVNYRVNQNYLDTISMIEKRILNSDHEVTDLKLQALLPAPDHKETVLVPCSRNFANNNFLNPTMSK